MRTYIVVPALAATLGEQLAVRKSLVLCITRQGALFLWPIRLPDSAGRNDEWSKTALAAAENARIRWTRIATEMSVRGYIVSEPMVEIPDPVWPDLIMAECMRLAFKDRIIRDENHPIIQRILGRV